MEKPRLNIQKYSAKELEKEIGKTSTNLGKEGKVSKIRETPEERSERFIRQTQVGISSKLKEKKPEQKSPEGM
ncbi:hypothetical protein A3F97_02295 [Candidatus Nomurabacteria bacterium RIFCSPLOWO2_12_FULL_41_10]|uniref:Uncharacterized protein n=1 Tax=Candidatus Nomurabacteria bacterium RIFCSPLOWO2_12_FULL_41_10 TaxID=1801795 RepID=A0A1F6YD81_9BACT|nr:MAG: hypothetical protein A3F97_02295 [Candidatus Nomurabacteria bacterium RIFCSPLOWO2_12_FULL_41_10]